MAVAALLAQKQEVYGYETLFREIGYYLAHLEQYEKGAPDTRTQFRLVKLNTFSAPILRRCRREDPERYTRASGPSADLVSNLQVRERHKGYRASVGRRAGTAHCAGTQGEINILKLRVRRGTGAKQQTCAKKEEARLFHDGRDGCT